MCENILITKDSIQHIERLIAAGINKISVKGQRCADVDTRRLLLELFYKHGGKFTTSGLRLFQRWFPGHRGMDEIKVELTQNGQVELKYEGQSKIFDIDDSQLNSIPFKWARV